MNAIGKSASDAHEGQQGEVLNRHDVEVLRSVGQPQRTNTKENKSIKRKKKRSESPRQRGGVKTGTQARLKKEATEDDDMRENQKKAKTSNEGDQRSFYQGAVLDFMAKQRHQQQWRRCSSHSAL